MGLAGRGALTRQQRAELPKRTTKFPWEKPKLSRLAKVIAFLEFLPITKGKLSGRKLKLLPAQRAFIEALYGRTKDQVRLGIFSEPRGNGKTGLITGLVLCHLLGPEAEMRGECYSAAIDRQQAALIFDELEAIIHAVPEFKARTNIRRWHKSIEVIEGYGI